MAPTISFSRLAALAFSLVVMAGAAQPAHAQGVSVSGNAFVRDGAKWVPQGFSLVGLVAPKGHAMGPGFARARELYGPELFERARSLGANTLRLQVSQPGLDPESSIFDPAYTQDVVDAVRQARGAGFVVIVSMQWEKPAGLAGLPNMPNDSTTRAWSRIGGAFANDGDVMLELFNEPKMWETNPESWPTWQRGMQAEVDAVRATGAKNVLILDGIRSSHILEGAPPIHDPLGKLAYAVHPYFQDYSKSDADWEQQWGRFADSHPVLISEWNATSALENCNASTPGTARQFFDFIARRRIGVLIWTLDMPDTVVDATGAPVSFQNFTCGAQGSGGAASLAVQYMKSVR